MGINKTAIGRVVVGGRVLEILATHIRGGLSTYKLRDELNRTKFRGAVANWYKHGFATKEVAAFLRWLSNGGLVKRKANGNKISVWYLNGGVGVLPARPRNRWGEARLFRFSGGKELLPSVQLGR